MSGETYLHIFIKTQKAAAAASADTDCVCRYVWSSGEREKLLHAEKDDERGFIVKVRHQTFAVSINLHIIPEPRKHKQKGNGILRCEVFTDEGGCQRVCWSVLYVTSASSWCWRHWSREFFPRLPRRKEEEKIFSSLLGVVCDLLLFLLSFSQQHFLHPHSIAAGLRLWWNRRGCFLCAFFFSGGKKGKKQSDRDDLKRRLHVFERVRMELSVSSLGRKFC